MPPSTTDVVLDEMIQTLRQQVADLQARIEALEKLHLVPHSPKPIDCVGQTPAHLSYPAMYGGRPWPIE